MSETVSSKRLGSCAGKPGLGSGRARPRQKLTQRRLDSFADQTL